MSACPTDCGGSVRLGHVMCARCWALVPKRVQHEVWRTYRAFERGAYRTKEMALAQSLAEIRPLAAEYHKARETAIASARERLIKRELRA